MTSTLSKQATETPAAMTVSGEVESFLHKANESSEQRNHDKWKTRKVQNTRRFAIVMTAVVALIGAYQVKSVQDEPPMKEQSTIVLEMDLTLREFSFEPAEISPPLSLPMAEPPSETRRPMPGHFYVVRRGDDLTKITQTLPGSSNTLQVHHRWIAAIVSANEIENLHHIEPGWRLWIPASPGE